LRLSRETVGGPSRRGWSGTSQLWYRKRLMSGELPKANVTLAVKRLNFKESIAVPEVES